MSSIVALQENATFNNYAHQHNSDLDIAEEFGLHHFTYNNSAILDFMFQSIANIEFTGITVSYWLNHVNYYGL